VRGDQDDCTNPELPRVTRDEGGLTAEAWLRDHDPMRTLEGARAAVVAALSPEQLVNLRIRRRGRLSREQSKIRTDALRALAPVWATYQHGHIAEALGMDERQARKLMEGVPRATGRKYLGPEAQAKN
jgi:hypothetical protein